MLKRLRRLFKADVTLRFYDEGDKTIIEHDLKTTMFEQLPRQRQWLSCFCKVKDSMIQLK